MQKIFFIALFSLLNTIYMVAQNTAAARLQAFNVAGKIAIQGYDPVAYFTQRKAIKGNAAITATHEGIQYNFASAANKTKFLSATSQYEPQYGGWCAYALGARNMKVEIDPDTFKIIDGKLYLFYNAYFNNTLTSWNKDEKNLLPKSIANWAKLIR
jgi:YHS domain-containing protein